MGRLRAYLFAGVLVTAPIAITAYLAWLVVSFVDERVTKLLPHDYNPNNYLPFAIPGFGLVVIALALMFIGWFAAGLVGRLTMRAGEALVARMPVVSNVYSAVKQIFETVLKQRATTFRTVVLVEFPRKGLWRVGFLTGDTPGRTQGVHPTPLANVFIPNTPNVATGFLVLVPRDELLILELTPEEALKLIVSAGIAVPAAEQLAARTATQPERNSATAPSRSNR
ncbi:MAG: DUF502 domain-containing protein [Alphaproteobacteria bacterium]|nr:DUF502 domain-containing protein [Alphaproteobacteria bacterium]